jgi:hypothetical protein
MKRRKIGGHGGQYGIFGTASDVEDIEPTKPYKVRRANAYEIVDASNAKRRFSSAIRRGLVGAVSFTDERRYEPFAEENLYHFLTLLLKHNGSRGHIPEYNTGDSDLEPILYGMGERNRDRAQLAFLQNSNIYKCLPKVLQLNSAIANGEFVVPAIPQTDDETKALLDITINSLTGQSNPYGIEEEPPGNVIARASGKDGTVLMVLALSIQKNFGLAFTGVKYTPSLRCVMLLFAGMNDTRFNLFCVGTIEGMSAEAVKTLSDQEGLHDHQDPFTMDVSVSAFSRPRKNDIPLTLALSQAAFHYINMGFCPLFDVNQPEDSHGHMNTGRPRGL